MDPMTLPELLDTAWTEMHGGTVDRTHGFHLPVGSTVRDGRPTGRVLVLRAAERENGRLLFHTDVRSCKVGELKSGMAVTFYDPPRRLQVRVSGSARLADPATTQTRWELSSTPSRKTYLVDPAPGTVVPAWTSGHSGALLGAGLPTAEQSEEGRKNFGVIGVFVDEIEVLRLERLGHQRARFQRDDGWSGVWLAP